MSHRAAPAHATRATSDNDLTAAAAATHLQQHDTRQLAHTIPWTYMCIHLQSYTFTHAHIHETPPTKFDVTHFAFLHISFDITFISILIYVTSPTKQLELLLFKLVS